MRNRNLISIVLIGTLVIAGSVAYAAAKWPEPAQTTDSSQPQMVTAAAPSSGQSLQRFSNDPAFQMKMAKLLNSSENWNALSHDEKVAAVDVSIDLFKKTQNAAILNSAEFYTQKLDESFSKDPSMMILPLPTAVRILSVMEYDFYNGQDKDGYALQLLGQDLYERNKKRREQEGIR